MSLLAEVTTDHKLYNNFLNIYRGSPFLSPNFLEPIKNKNIDTIYLLLKRNNLLIGGISGIIIKSNKMVVNRFNLFKGIQFYSGPFYTEEKNIPIINKMIYNYIKNKGYSKYLNHGYDKSIDMYVENTDIISKVHYDFVIDLNRPYDIIYVNYHRKFKKKIRMAKNHNLIFRSSLDISYLDVMEKLLEDTKIFREEKGYQNFQGIYFPFINLSNLKNIIKNNFGKFYFIEEDGEILSIQLVIHMNKQAIALFIGTSPSGYEKCANSLLHDKTIETLSEEKYLSYNLLGLPTTNWEGLEIYKLHMGARKIETWSMISPFLQNNFFYKIFKNFNRR